MTQSQVYGGVSTPFKKSLLLEGDRRETFLQRCHWLRLFLLIGTFTTAIVPHPPLIALATVAGVTMPPSRAVKATIALWISSEVLGYSLQGYPLTPLNLMWSAAIGLGMVLALSVASYRPAWSRASQWRQWLWTAIAFGTSFGLFHGLIMLFWSGLGGHGYTWPVLAHLLGQETVWLIACLVFYKRLRTL